VNSDRSLSVSRRPYFASENSTVTDFFPVFMYQPRTKQTARKSTGGVAPRKSSYHDEAMDHAMDLSPDLDSCVFPSSESSAVMEEKVEEIYQLLESQALFSEEEMRKLRRRRNYSTIVAAVEQYSEDGDLSELVFLLRISLTYNSKPVQFEAMENSLECEMEKLNQFRQLLDSDIQTVPLEELEGKVIKHLLPNPLPQLSNKAMITEEQISLLTNVVQGFHKAPNTALFNRNGELPFSEEINEEFRLTFDRLPYDLVLANKPSRSADLNANINSTFTMQRK